MIVRVFRAKVKPGMREAFARLCHDMSIPYLRAEPGLLALHFGQPSEEPDLFALVTVWRDLDGLKAFTGEQWEQVVILPGEADLVIETSVEHYDESCQGVLTARRAVAALLREREEDMTQRVGLSDAQWELIKEAIPPSAKEGRPRANDRRTLEGILYVLRTGCRWHDLPSAYGNAVTCWRRFRRWEASGAWEHIWRMYFSTLLTREKVAWASPYLSEIHAPAPQGRRRMPS